MEIDPADFVGPVRVSRVGNLMEWTFAHRGIGVLEVILHYWGFSKLWTASFEERFDFGPGATKELDQATTLYFAGMLPPTERARVAAMALERADNPDINFEYSLEPREVTHDS